MLTIRPVLECLDYLWSLYVQRDTSNRVMRLGVRYKEEVAEEHANLDITRELSTRAEVYSSAEKECEFLA